MKSSNVIDEKAFKFSIRVVHLYKFLSESQREYVMSKQVLKSGTSIGANIREALAGQSRKDFIAKLSISLKEASETRYWLELLKETKYIDPHFANSLIADVNELFSLLTSIIKTTKKKLS